MFALRASHGRPERSASGRSLLLANPHLPWGDVFTWYEAQLVSPDVSVYGATLVGQPFVSIAFNDDLGWTHTVNTIDAADLYELTLEEGQFVRPDGPRAVHRDGSFALGRGCRLGRDRRAGDIRPDCLDTR